MDKKIELNNQSQTIKFPILFSYSIAQNDIYHFYIKMKAEKGKEYAVLFINGDDSFYTAEIIGSEISEKSFTVLKLKIAQCEEVRIVDIETEQVVFKSVFNTNSNIAQKTIEEDPQNDSETFEAASSKASIAVIEQDKPAVKLMGTITEEKLDICDDVSDNEQKENPIEEIEFYADYEKESSDPSILQEEDEDDLSSPELFMQENMKSSEISKAQKAALVNDNDSILEDVFERFDYFESPLKNHEFYDLNESNAKKSSLKIILNGFIVPILSPFLEYKNPFGSGNDHPKYLIGKASLSDETEYFVYGTLGRNLREEQPFSGATGFVYFEKIKDSDEGYWLMYVNAKTGRISLPMKPKNTWNT